MGVSIADMALISIGELVDLYAEANRDSAEEDEDSEREAAQADFDGF